MRHAVLAFIRPSAKLTLPSCRRSSAIRLCRIFKTPHQWSICPLGEAGTDDGGVGRGSPCNRDDLSLNVITSVAIKTEVCTRLDSRQTSCRQSDRDALRTSIEPVTSGSLCGRCTVAAAAESTFRCKTASLDKHAVDCRFLAWPL